jgi:protein-disulfide isomerase
MMGALLTLSGIALAGQGADSSAAEASDELNSFSIPPALAPADLPGVIMVGSQKSKWVLYEFFDYACSYCRLAWQELEVLVGPESGISIGLVQHPVLGVDSRDAAKMVLAAQGAWGNGMALQLHRRLFETPGPLSVDKTLKLAESLSMDTVRLKRQAETPEIQAVLDAQVARAKALGLRYTPGFVLRNRAFMGWPGAESMQKFIQG